MDLFLAFLDRSNGLCRRSCGCRLCVISRIFPARAANGPTQEVRLIAELTKPLPFPTAWFPIGPIGSLPWTVGAIAPVALRALLSGPFRPFRTLRALIARYACYRRLRIIRLDDCLLISLNGIVFAVFVAHVIVVILVRNGERNRLFPFTTSFAFGDCCSRNAMMMRL